MQPRWDPHIAANYKRANYSEVQDIQACHDLYNRVAVEIMRAVNFYGFNTPTLTCRISILPAVLPA